ncbi:Phosphate-repressible phosphate permease pho-4 [Smittium mucronatum]|uniref:Phosphate transporter n=1 Tax=Smittium mucronatum TaxID=133383 RepID=A0A1R0GSR9_9FUNG|nr:Phosphate-repressible phosphate permease pho-4 [Smittium mucronatum]
MNPHMYTFLFVMVLIFSFADAYGNGANDVANSFATSVSSGTLTLTQAVCIAIVTEFCGAYFLGSGTANTISGGIIDVTQFSNQPELLMLGMTMSVLGSATWVIFATSQGWPVSSTHSITGAIIGMSIAAYGGGSVKWGYDGVAKIVTSWFVSPLIAGVVASIIFLVTKYAVLQHQNSFKRGLLAIPVYVFIAFWVNITFIISKGLPGTKAVNWSFKKIVGISCAISAGIGLLAFIFYSNWLRRKIQNREDMKIWMIFVSPFIGTQPIIPETTEDDIKATKEASDLEAQAVENKPLTRIDKIKKIIFNGVNQEVRNLNNPRLADIHARAKKYDNDTELLFEFIQVLTACAASFAHGSNDVANSVGPLSTVYRIWQTGKVPGKSVSVAAWNLAFCAAGIDVGLATYGYHIMRALGNNVTYTTPSRGFAAELGTSLTIVTASKIGLPVSTSHCITGAMVGVGLCNGDWRAINWKMFGITFLSWVITLPFAGLASGLLFAFVAYSPMKV